MNSLVVERIVIGVFIFLCALFALEIIHYAQSGQWIIHAGTHGFYQWPQPATQNQSVLIHSLGMLLWVALVIYQMKTRGKGSHVWVGRLGALLVLLALLLAYGPAVASAVPALHGVGGFSLIDITLMVNAVAIATETLVGIFKARSRHLAEHRQHLMVAVLFTAAPALYRAFFQLLSQLDVPSADAFYPELHGIWAHELAACLAILCGIVVLLTRTFSGHISALRAPKGRLPRPVWHKPAALGMLGICFALTLLFGFWTLDLVLMDLHGVLAFSRDQAPAWISYMGRP